MCLKPFVRVGLVALSIGVLPVLTAPVVAAPIFFGLGDLPGGSFNSSIPFLGGALSDDGRVVVGQSRSANNDFEAFRWTAETGMVGLGDLPGGVFTSRATGVSGDGSVVVGRGTSGSTTASSGNQTEAFRWTEADGMVGLGDIPGGATSSRATDVSADGKVIVGLSGGDAFRWTEADGMVSLGGGSDGTIGRVAQATNEDGSVIVGEASSPDGRQGFRWTEADGMTGIGDLAGGVFQSTAYGVSADGKVIVGQGESENGPEAFRWTEENGMVGLGDLTGGVFNSLAFDTNADGSVIVGQAATEAGGVAMIWDETHGMRDFQQVLVSEYGLDLTGWILSLAQGISADGQVIAGSGINPNGQAEAWLVSLRGTDFPGPTPVPLPSSIVLLGSGLIGLFGLIGFRRRKSRQA